jgi:hypothetical protein
MLKTTKSSATDKKTIPRKHAIKKTGVLALTAASISFLTTKSAAALSTENTPIEPGNARPNR